MKKLILLTFLVFCTSLCRTSFSHIPRDNGTFTHTTTVAEPQFVEPIYDEPVSRDFVPVSSFSDVNKHIKNLNPGKTVIFIDIDKTLIKDGKGSRTKATLIDPSALKIIAAWKEKGFHVALLTARMEGQYQSTIDDLNAIGIKGPMILLMTHGVKKGEWLKKQLAVKNSTAHALLSGANTIIHIDDHAFQLDSVNKAFGHGHSHLFHFGASSNTAPGYSSYSTYSEERTDAYSSNQQ